MEIPLKSKNNVGLDKPVSLFTLTLYFALGMLILFLIFRTPLRHMNFFFKLAFGVLGMGMAFLLSHQDKAKQQGFMTFMALFNYYPKQIRQVSTGPLDKVDKVQNLYGIKSIDEDTAVIYFKDGMIGRVYEIVGTASQLMFEMDRAAVVGEVDRFYRKKPVGCEIIYDTLKEPQRVDKQLAACEERHARLRSSSPGLQKLYDERHEILEYGVGNQFKSIHQYAVVRASNDETLNQVENLIRADAEGKAMIFKRVTVLNYDRLKKYFKGIFYKDESR